MSITKLDDSLITTYPPFVSISATKTGEQVKNQIARALVARIVRAGREGTKFKVCLFCHLLSLSLFNFLFLFLPRYSHLQVIVCIPELPGFAGDIKAETSIKTIMAAQYRTMNRGGSSIYEEVRKAGYEP